MEKDICVCVKGCNGRLKETALCTASQFVHLAKYMVEQMSLTLHV